MFSFYHFQNSSLCTEAIQYIEMFSSFIEKEHAFCVKTDQQCVRLYMFS